MLFVVLGLGFGMAEVHAGTAAGVDRAVFALAADTWWRHGSTESLRPRWSCAWSAMPGRARFLPGAKARPRSRNRGPSAQRRTVQESKGLFKRKVAAPGAEWVVDPVFTDSERERVAALWRLTALPRAEFDGTYGDML